MSTFLELVQDLHRESGAAGVAPTAVTSQTGEANRLVGWIREGDFYVQTLWLNWKFLWAQATLPLATGIADYASPTGLQFWDYNTFKIDGDPIGSIEWNAIKTEVLDVSNAYPSRVIIMPDNSLKMEPVPDTTYSLTGDYFVKPTKLAANDDVSAIPEEYHQIILGRALILYANYESAPEQKEQGQEIYAEALARLENHQLPNQRYSRYDNAGTEIEVIAGQ